MHRRLGGRISRKETVFVGARDIEGGHRFGPAPASAGAESQLSIPESERLAEVLAGRANEAVLFVAHSPTRGGVVTVLQHLLAGWPESDGRQLLLVHNRAHGGKAAFQDLAKRDARILVIEAPVFDHMWFLAKPGNASSMRRVFIKVLNRLLSPAIMGSAIWYFFRLCRRFAVSTVFSHNGGYPGGFLNRCAIIGAWIAKVPRNYLVVHNLAVRPRALRLPGAWVHDRMINRSVTGIITVSQACTESLVETRFLSKLYGVIHNGIPVPAVNDGHRMRHKINDIVIAYVGELTQRKGVHVLLAAIALLPQGARLVIFGMGNPHYERKLRDDVTALGIEKRVVFKGFDPDVANKLDQVDILVLPSLSFESFGMVLLEAMAHRTPVIVTDVGGMKEVVVDGETGRVVPAGDPQSLARALQGLIDDPELARQFGENGYRRLRDVFSIETMVRSYYCLSI